MKTYKEWIIRYHGDLQQSLSGTDTMIDIISEQYAIIKASQGEIPYLQSLMEIECLEASRPITQLIPSIDLGQVRMVEKTKQGVSGKGVTVGWISHRANINHNNYNTYDGKTRILCLHDGEKQYTKEQLQGRERGFNRHECLEPLSAMDVCIGNQGIAQESDIIVVNWQASKFSTADAIRAVRFMMSKVNSKEIPLVIYLPFDLTDNPGQATNLAQEIICEMTLWGKVALVSSLASGSQTLGSNLKLVKGPILSSCAHLTVGALALLMEWGVVRGNDPLLYGQKLRTYYLRSMAPLLKQEQAYTRMCSLDDLDELLRRLIPMPEVESFRTLDLAYEFAPKDEKIDAFIVYNNLMNELIIPPPSKTNFYPLVFPYLGVRGTVEEIKEILSGYLEVLVTGSLAYILGREPLEIRPTKFKSASILNKSTDILGAGTLFGIIDTGIDYTNPAFIDGKGETRIASIWDQTMGEDSPYGYGTVYSREMINQALKSDNPLDIVPHIDESGSGTMLAGIAVGFSQGGETTYKGMAPEAEIVAVKLIPATPVMQEIYHSQYTSLGFSALDIARAFEYLATLANEYQRPIAICMPMGTNSGPHDGTSILDTIIMSYSENPGVCVVLPAGEEANKGHHASGDLKIEKEQEIKLVIPKNEGGFIVEVWADFGDRVEVSLTTPSFQGEAGVSKLLNKGQTYQLPGNAFVWSQGSKIDYDTGCQVIRFRLANPFPGDWIIRVKGVVIIEGHYNIWIPKTGMILPDTVLVPADPFTTIYNTSSANRLITVSCYDRKSLSPTASSGRGFARDHMVKPDFMVPAVDIPAPLPGNKWGLTTGTVAASAIAAGASLLVFGSQLALGAGIANTLTMKAILINELVRDPTISYPNPSRGYGLLDINTIIQ